MNLLRKGRRLNLKKNRKKAKIHYGYIKEIMEILDVISKLIYWKDITEENISEEVAKVSDIKLGSIEKTILLNKIRKLKDENKRHI